MALQRPLDPKAVKAANAAIAAETGGRPLTMSPADAALRQKWTEAYLAAGGKQSQPTPQQKAQKAATKAEQKMPATPVKAIEPCYVPSPEHPVIRPVSEEDKIYRRWRELLVQKGYMSNVLMNPLYAVHAGNPGEVKAFYDLHEQARKEVLGDRYTPQPFSTRAAAGILGGIDFINQFGDLKQINQNKDLGKLPK